MIKITVAKENFLKVKETLTRMGIANSKSKILYQSCHILFKQNAYYIVHFKELLALDGLDVKITEEDIQRRDSIAIMLQSWKLIDIIKDNDLEELTNNFRVISYKDKSKWKLVSKYNIGQ